MAKINSEKTIQRRRTEDTMRQALTAFCNGTAERTIPPQVDDTDIVLNDAIEELLEARAKLASIEGFMRQWLAKAQR